MRMRRTRSDVIFDTANLIFWIVVLFLVCYPLWLIIVASVSDPSYVIKGEVFLLPKGVSWVGYKAILEHSELIRSYLNSIVYTVLGTLLSVTVTMMAAYALSQRFRGKGVLNFIIVFTMFFSGGLIPQFLMNKQLGLYDNVLIMIIINCVSVWNLMVARTYISSTIPRELQEAAEMDGANHFTYFFKCVLPLSGTIIAVLTLYYGVARWNDYFTAVVYIKDRHLLPLQTVLREIVALVTTSTSSSSLFESLDDGAAVADAIRKAQVAKYCAIVVSTVPTVILYITMQKYFVKGVLIGSLKG